MKLMKLNLACLWAVVGAERESAASSDKSIARYRYFAIPANISRFAILSTGISRTLHDLKTFRVKCQWNDAACRVTLVRKTI
jgi:hypothetical protein